MTDPTWDQIVDRVSVQSNYLMLVNSSQRWKAATEEMDVVREKLLNLAVESADRWQGEGSKAFQEHLRTLARAMETMKVRHQGISPGLDRISEHLRVAVRSIPIPSWRLGEVQQKQAAFARWGTTPQVEPVYLFQIGQMISPGSEGARADFEAWYLGRYTEALEAYRKLEANYRGEVGQLPEGTAVASPTVRQPGDVSGAAAKGGGTGVGGKGVGGSKVGGGTGVGGKGLGTGTGTGTGTDALSNLGSSALSGVSATPYSGSTGTGTTGYSGVSTPSYASADLSDLASSGLGTSSSGLPDYASSSGSSGLGDLPDYEPLETSGLAGVGSLGGAGVGSFGGSGIGGLPSLGASADLPASVTSGFGSPGSQTKAGLSGVGTSGQSAGSAGSMYPMMPGTGAGGGGGGQGSADTMLHEDEVKAMFGFETDRSSATRPVESDVLKGSVLEA